MRIFGKEEPESVTVGGRLLKCQVCDNGTFYHRHAQLHAGVATFFNLEWASPTCDCMVCSQCGYIHWFLPGE